jgi:hypothetical protein
MGVADAASAGPDAAPTAAVTALARSCGISVPAGAPPTVAFVKVTLNVEPVPDTAVATHGAAGAAMPLVPACEKSVAVSPTTGSENWTM